MSTQYPHQPPPVQQVYIVQPRRSMGLGGSLLLIALTLPASILLHWAAFGVVGAFVKGIAIGMSGGQ